MKLKSGYFIMKLWQTGNVGPRNIEKIDGQPKNGYLTHDVTRDSMIEMKKQGKNFELDQSFTTFAIMEIYWWSK